jgi:excisionase family DNA binding protein
MYDPNLLLQKTKLRIDEAAELLEVTSRTVQNYLDQQKLTTALTPGGHRRVKNDEKFRGYL